MAIQFSDEDKKKLENDKSEIYTKRTNETYAEYVKKLKGRNKGQYFVDYYLKFLIAAVMIAALVIMFIRHAVSKPPETVLSVAIDKDAFEDETLEEFEKEVADVLELDPQKEKVSVFTSSDDQQLQTFLYVGRIDVLITDEKDFKKWAEGGYFLEPGTSPELSFYEEYPKDVRYYSHYVSPEEVRGEVLDDNTEYNFGVRLSSYDKYSKELGGFVPDPVAGISASTENVYYACEFIKYMTDMKQTEG